MKKLSAAETRQVARVAVKTPFKRSEVKELYHVVGSIDALEAMCNYAMAMNLSLGVLTNMLNCGELPSC